MEESSTEKCGRILASAKRLGVMMHTYQGPDGYAFSFIDPVGGLETMGPFRSDRKEALESSCDLWIKTIQMVE